MYLYGKTTSFSHHLWVIRIGRKGLEHSQSQLGQIWNNAGTTLERSWNEVGTKLEQRWNIVGTQWPTGGTPGQEGIKRKTKWEQTRVKTNI